MTLHSTRPYAETLEPGRNVVVALPAGVDPVFKRSARTVMGKHAAIPDALQGRYLVKPRATACSKCEVWVRAYRGQQDLEVLDLFRGGCKPFGKSQFVIRVERRRVTARAA